MHSFIRLRCRRIRRFHLAKLAGPLRLGPVSSQTCCNAQAGPPHLTACLPQALLQNILCIQHSHAISRPSTCFPSPLLCRPGAAWPQTPAPNTYTPARLPRVLLHPHPISPPPQKPERILPPGNAVAEQTSGREISPAHFRPMRLAPVRYP